MSIQKQYEFSEIANAFTGSYYVQGAMTFLSFDDTLKLSPFQMPTVRSGSFQSCYSSKIHSYIYLSEIIIEIVKKMC